MSRIVIRNGHIIDPASQRDSVGDLYIAAGKIVAIDSTPDGFTANHEIDASGCWVMPGLIDLRARLREPGQEHKGTIASETKAAVSAGVTTVCMPPDTQPIIDTPAVVELIHRRAEAAGQAKVVTLGALTVGLLGEHLSEMVQLRQAGCVGMTNLDHPIHESRITRRAMEYAASSDITVFINAEDDDLAGNGCAHEGQVSTRLGLAGIPEAAETLAVSRKLMLIEQTGVRAHFSQLSTARAVQMIKRAQYDGLPVTADVSAHQLHLTEMDIGYFDSNCHVHPPLRTQRDRDGLRQGLRESTISVICSDHQPHDRDAKLAPFGETEPGISAIETLLPLSLRLVDEGILSRNDAIARLTCQPASILKLEAGSLALGQAADICIFDPAQRWTLSEADMLSQGHNTPFIGWEFHGRVRQTLINGRLVYHA
jgi:dihydroorotase